MFRLGYFVRPALLRYGSGIFFDEDIRYHIYIYIYTHIYNYVEYMLPVDCSLERSKAVRSAAEDSSIYSYMYLVRKQTTR